MRASTYAVPKDADLASTCAIPIAVACQPLAEQPSEEAPVPLVDFGPSGPPRCSRCAGYINNWCTWTRGGASWACNLCGSETEGQPTARSWTCADADAPVQSRTSTSRTSTR